MPLPEKDMQWPPPQLTHILNDISTWSAWYSGDPASLSTAYGAVDTTGPRPLTQVRPSQYAGGVVGAVARWFWGQPTPAGHQRTKLHVPVAADIATASSDLLFAEQPTIVTNDDDTKRKRLNKILEGVAWESLLPESGEIAAALTGVYQRIVWDENVADHPLITVVPADSAWPEFSFGKLRAVTFWQVVARNGSTVVRHLERHEPGRILHGLYQGTETQLGRRIPLTEHHATADITVDEDAGVDTGTSLLTAVYIPNVKPTRRPTWRNDPIGSNLGRSDFDGIEPAMDALDETYTSWMRDVRIGKARIIVDQAALETEGRGHEASFDLDREVYEAVNIMSGSGDDAPITPYQFEIRAEAHQATIRALLERIISGAGYSLQTFGVYPEGSGTTATEVSARERKSMTTREKKTRYWAPALTHLLTALLEVDRAKFRGPGPFDQMTIEFPPSTQPTPAELAQTAQLLSAAQAASIRTRVKMVHPDWDKTAVDEEVDLIMGENSLSVPAFGPLPADRAPAVDETE
ncbi:phage portal protein [Aeromicrobium phragmitis]|nr:phage portal protein [Aeromicrobium phragmitis]